MDSAAHRRFALKFYVPLPDKIGRRKIIQNLLSVHEHKHDMSNEDLDQIALQTEGFSGSDMTKLCKVAGLTIFLIQSKITTRLININV